MANIELIKAYIDLATLVLWLISLLGVGIFGRLHFKSKRAEEFNQLAQALMKSYVCFYDRSQLDNQEKLTKVVSEVVAGLRDKGFDPSEQDVRNIVAGVEQIVMELRASQQG